MRTLLGAALLLISTVAVADGAPKPLSIVREAMGDGEHGIVTRILFQFANPRSITEAGLFIEGWLTEGDGVPRYFRFAVPRKGDKFHWHSSISLIGRKGGTHRHYQWAVLPDQRNQMTMLHTFAEGEAEIEVRLVLEADYGASPTVVAKATETFTVAKTNRVYVEDPGEMEMEAEAPAVPATVPEELSAVAIRTPQPIEDSDLVLMSVETQPQVKRVEFWVEDKKVLARNAPPYDAELDLGELPDRVLLRAIGYDASGRYVDADAFVLNDTDAASV